MHGRPFLTVFSDSDPVTSGAEKYFQKFIPGAQGLDHVTIKNGGHFLQEDQGEALAEAVVRFLKEQVPGRFREFFESRIS